MGSTSSIEWTDATWNPTRGCRKVTKECENCYAMAVAHRFSAPGMPYEGLTRKIGGRAQWTGQARFIPEALELPLTWSKPRHIFVDSMSDLFHEDISDLNIAEVLGVAVAAVHLRGHKFTILTKRPERMRELLLTEEFWAQVNSHADMIVMDRVDPLNRRRNDARATLDYYGPENPPPGIWLGVSVGDQATADARREALRATPATIKLVSYEPAIGPIDWAGWEFVHQIISGGESSPNARPSHPSWHRAARDFCAAHGVAYFFKQWGEWSPGYAEHGNDLTYDLLVKAQQHEWPEGFVSFRVSKKAAGRLLDGREHNDFPRVSS